MGGTLLMFIHKMEEAKEMFGQALSLTRSLTEAHRDYLDT